MIKVVSLPLICTLSSFGVVSNGEVEIVANFDKRPGNHAIGAASPDGYQTIFEG